MVTTHVVKPLPFQTELTDYGKTFTLTLHWMIIRNEHETNIDPKYSNSISFQKSDGWIKSKTSWKNRPVINKNKFVKNDTHEELKMNRGKNCKY